MGAFNQRIKQILSRRPQQYVVEGILSLKGKNLTPLRVTVVAKGRKQAKKEANIEVAHQLKFLATKVYKDKK